MKNVERIIILYPGETSSERINTPGNYSLSRLLVQLNRSDDVPIYFLNWSRRYERYGHVRFIHFSTFNFLKLLLRFALRRNSLIVSQTGAYGIHARLLRMLMPGSRVLVRLGGVYYGKEYLESAAFRSAKRGLRRRLSFADMVMSTADGTPVDLYMRQLGIPPHRYKKLMNGFPVIANESGTPRENRILCISRLSPEKNVDYVIRSFANALPQLKTPHRLVIVGDGPDRDSLQTLAEELGVATEIEFAGESYDVGRFLYASKVLVSGFANNTVIEAIATATPVITVELGEMQLLYGAFPNVRVVEYAPGGYGKISAARVSGLVQRTADLLVDLLNNYPTEHAAVRPSTMYGWEQRLQDEITLYETMLAPAPAPHRKHESATA
jgi:glycosyltransferase involved in cell wall biosynthesis